MFRRVVVSTHEEIPEERVLLGFCFPTATAWDGQGKTLLMSTTSLTSTTVVNKFSRWLQLCRTAFCIQVVPPGCSQELRA